MILRLAPYRPRNTDAAIYDLTRTIRGVEIRVRLTYWQRRAGWYADIYADGELLVQGRRCTDSSPLVWRQRKDPPLPRTYALETGIMYLRSFAGDGSEVDQAGLGWTHALYWVDLSEIEQPAPIAVTVT